MELERLSDLDGLMSKLAIALLKLGCDIDEVVKQLFEPLALQMMHYYSHPDLLKKSHTEIIISTLIVSTYVFYMVYQKFICSPISDAP